MENKDFSGIRNNGQLPDPNEIEIPADIGDILSDYIESTTSMIEELEQAALSYEANNNRQENSGTIKRILHKIKGESSMVGIEQMSEFCHQTEYAFEELDENERPDMLLKFKDWVSAAINSITC
ncbi:MAG: Hpt domain-containing protein [Phycisphaerales bacterium]|jgi:chemotaxis protein histidine kinase CheA